jgi:quercetin dioxygenase-like cupin family protein
VIAALVLVAPAAAVGDNSMMGSGSSAKPMIYTPSTIKWMPGSGDIPSTVGVAVLDGNPGKPGPYTMRLKIPAGTKFPVHYHTGTERLTVISGTFMAGIGTTFDTAKMVALPAGSFGVLPAGLRHYGMAKVDTIVQLSGNGPFDMKMDKKPM